jgi:DNA-binding transcriptional MerR regulator
MTEEPMKDRANEQLLRTKDAATRLGLKSFSVRRLEQMGILPSIRDWAGHRRFRERDVEQVREKLLSGALNP